MKEDELQAIANYIGVPLPERYRHVIANYPLDPNDHNSKIVLWSDAQHLLAWNAELQEGEFAREWGSNRLAIGNSPCGDTFFLELNSDVIAVFAWDHETHAITKEANDIDSFVAEWKRYEEEKNAKSKKRKPGWNWFGFGRLQE